MTPAKWIHGSYRRQRRGHQQALNPGWRFVWPILLLYIASYIVPLLFFMRGAFASSTGLGELSSNWTASNVLSSLANPLYRQLLLLTLRLCGIVALGSIMLGYVIAYYAGTTGRLGRTLFVVSLAALFTNTVVRSLGWISLLSPSGPLMSSLRHLDIVTGLAPGGFFQVVVASISAQTPLVVAIMTPVVASIRPELHEVAWSLGGRKWEVAHRVVWPLTKLPLLGAGFLVFAGMAAAFVTPSLLGGGRVPVLSLVIEQQVLEFVNYPLAAALGVILVAVVGVVAIAAGRLSRYRGDLLEGA